MKDMSLVLAPTEIESPAFVEKSRLLAYFRSGLLRSLGALCRVVYRFDLEYLNTTKEACFDDVKLVVLLNHTSLFEPLWLGSFAPDFLGAMGRDFVYPVANKTLSRPLAGTIYKALAQVVGVSAQRDDSWAEFMTLVNESSIIGICPEGRMKRLNGLDRNGNPMTVRGGVAEILRNKTKGNMIFLYSGGLHHIHAPGHRYPKIFKTIKARFEKIAIEDYKQLINDRPGDFKVNMIKDMEKRRDHHCPPHIEATN